MRRKYNILLNLDVYLKYIIFLEALMNSLHKTFQQLRRQKNDDDNSSEEDGGDGAGGDSKMTSSGTQTQQVPESVETHNISALYHGTWPVERSLWHSGPSCIGGTSGSKSVTQVESFNVNVLLPCWLRNI